MVEAVASHTGVSSGLQIATHAIGTSVMSATIGGLLSHNVVGTVGHGPVYADSAFTTIFLIGAAGGVIGLILTLAMRRGRQPATGGEVVAH
ncbi:hypothetical protein [Streptomyces sp. KL116D]|uniref:hypothetical protein n=1 Tax=Streptomyces sp. KL116D TaxID=3045152 RepID=UPI00355820C8